MKELLRTVALPSGISLVGHAGLVTLLLVASEGTSGAVQPSPSQLEFIQVPESVPEPELEPEIVESEPEPSPEPEIEVRPRPAPRRAAAEPEPAASTEPPAPAEPIAFDQVMTGGAGSFSVPVGEGVERSGRVRPTRRVVREEPVPTGSPTGTGVVPLADLSERPQQPAGIRGRLQANYPTNARAQGIAGRASVRLRVQPNGAVRVIQVLNASAPEFGEACRRSLEGHGRWQPGRDDGGRAVATVVRFNCDFTVGG